MTDDAPGGARSPRMRQVGGGTISDCGVLETAIAACVAATPGGLAARSLASAVAEHLGVAPSRISPRGLSVALGVMIATGRLDEVAGRLVEVSQEHRQAG